MQELVDFMGQNMSVSTLHFVMIYTLLDLYGEDLYNQPIYDYIQTVESYQEYMAYWYLDSAYENVRHGVRNQVLLNQSAERKLQTAFELMLNVDSDIPDTVVHTFSDLSKDEFAKIVGNKYLNNPHSEKCLAMLVPLVASLVQTESYTQIPILLNYYKNSNDGAHLEAFKVFIKL